MVSVDLSKPSMASLKVTGPAALPNASVLSAVLQPAAVQLPDWLVMGEKGSFLLSECVANCVLGDH